MTVLILGDVAAALLRSRHIQSKRRRRRRRGRGTYLASRKFMAEVNAVYRQPKADGEAGHAESANHEDETVAVSAY